MLLNEEIIKIKEWMFLLEKKTRSNLFSKFDLEQFKNQFPPSDNSEETKKEIEYLKSINLNKKFVQEKDDIDGNFIEFLNKKSIDEKKIVSKLHSDSRYVVVELKNFYKRPRPFRVDSNLKDKMLDSMDGFSYPSGHSIQSNLIYLFLSHKYPKYKKELKKIKDDIVYSRQMARAHFPSDIEFGEKIAKKMFDFILDNKLIN
jgi:hypothetical protein